MALVELRIVVSAPQQSGDEDFHVLHHVAVAAERDLPDHAECVEVDARVVLEQLSSPGQLVSFHGDPFCTQQLGRFHGRVKYSRSIFFWGFCDL